MNLDGTAGDSYGGGFSLSVPAGGEDLWDGGNGQPSDRAFVVAMAAVSSAPAAPTGLVATEGDGEVSLTWDVTAGADSYNLKRSTTSGGPWGTIASPATPGYVDTAVANGSTYFYVVSAVGAGGEGGDSGEVEATPLSPGQSWRLLHFGTIENIGDAADDADPEGDDIVNLLERAFGGDPGESDPGILPRVDPSMPTLSMLYQVALDAGDLSIFVEENADLQGDWDPAQGSAEIVGESGNIRTMRFTRPVGDDESAMFLRVGVQAQ